MDGWIKYKNHEPGAKNIADGASILGFFKLSMMSSWS